jgi:transcriptional regulator with XRE-family HTH domain
MDPLEIIYRLRRLEKTQAGIAAELGVSHATVNNVIHSRITSRRVALHISKLLKKPLKRVFPDRYGTSDEARTGRPQG